MEEIDEKGIVVNKLMCAQHKEKRCCDSDGEEEKDERYYEAFVPMTSHNVKCYHGIRHKGITLGVN